ncbi:MAG TPA: phosphatidylglycerophosphatase A [Thermodesulfobacteriota bacterium]
MKERLSILVSSFFYLGYSPVAPGTVGTLGAVLLFYLISGFSNLEYVLFTIVFIILSVWVSEVARIRLGDSDPSSIVIDEVCGFLVTMILIPPSIINIALGFLLFRFFDILKPPPIRRSETLPGGLGIVADDVLAGIYANILLQIFARVSG